MKKYRDHYFLKAKRENYPARSVYKLKEIQKRFKIFKPGMKVLDLGASPGSWSLGASEMVGASGLVVGVDLKELETTLPPQAHFIRSDIFDPTPELQDALQEYAPFQAVISDMAPNTTGHRGTDQARSAALYEEALELAVNVLEKGGSFIVKVFMGPDVQKLLGELRRRFTTAKGFKPESSRSESMETFFIATGFKGPEFVLKDKEQ